MTTMTARELPPQQALINRIRIMRYATIANWVGLLVYLTASSWLLQTENVRPVVTWSIQCIPLLLLLPGLIRGTVSTHLWACFMALVYFTQGVVAAFRPEMLVAGIIEVVLSLDLFVAAMLYARWEGARSRTTHPRSGTGDSA